MSQIRRCGLSAVLLLVMTSAGLGVAAGPAGATSSVTAIAPTQGVPGQVVAVTGTGFTALSVVDFSNGVPAAPTSYVGSTRLNATVPSGAISGLVSVTTGAVTVYSAASFTVLTTPAITLSASSGPPTTNVTVTGTGFAPYERVNVYFQSTDLLAAATNATGALHAVDLTIPASTQPGNYWITVEGKRGLYSADAPFAVHTNWSQFGYGSKRTSDNPYENTLNSSNVGGLNLDWSNQIRQSAGAASGGLVEGGPVVANGVVYAADFQDANGYGCIEGWYASTGVTEGSYCQSGVDFWATPTYVNGLLYVIGSNDVLYALNANPQVDNDVLYLVWSATLPSTAASESAYSPVVANGLLYVPYNAASPGIDVLNAANGLQLTTIPLPTGATGGGNNLAIANGVIYDAITVATGFATYSDEVEAFGATSFAPEWTSVSLGTSYLGEIMPVVSNGLVYEAAHGNFYALNAVTGAVAWSTTTATVCASNCDFTFGPAIANGIVYEIEEPYACNSSLTSAIVELNASSGSIAGSFATDGVAIGTPVIANGVLYTDGCGGNGGLVSAYNLTYGNLLWNGSLSNWDGTRATPCVADGVLYASAVSISTNDGSITAFDLQGSDTDSRHALPDPKLLTPDSSLKITQ